MSEKRPYCNYSGEARVLDAGDTLPAAGYTHPNHSGDVTSVGDGAQTIGDEKVTYAKMQHVSATDKVLGRSTAGAGDVEEIPCTAAGRALLDDATAAVQRETLGLSVLSTQTLSDYSAVAISNNGQVMTKNAWTASIYEDEEWDPSNSYNPATGVFTVPIAGMYMVACGNAVNDCNACTRCSMKLSVNGADAVVGGNHIGPGSLYSGTGTMASLCAPLYLGKDSTLQASFWFDDGIANRNCYANGTYNYLRIVYMGA